MQGLDWAWGMVMVKKKKKEKNTLETVTWSVRNPILPNPDDYKGETDFFF